MNLVDHIIKKLQSQIKSLKKLIISNKIKCEYKVMNLSRNSKTFENFIKSKNPYHIDWSNICDSLHPKDFLKIAQNSSTKDTIHQAHFMNWHSYVFGTNLLDYGDNK